MILYIHHQSSKFSFVKSIILLYVVSIETLVGFNPHIASIGSKSYFFNQMLNVWFMY